VDTRAGGRGAASYPAWHPDGKLIAFSRNALLQIFHTAGEDVREVIDRDSDLGLYDAASGNVSTVPQISRPDRLESWPAWSPDGRYLYFSSARQISTDRRNPPPDWETIRYDLHRVRFDAASGAWGEPETVVAAASVKQSISEPAVSPDGRFLLFTAHDHGSFPIFQPSADLWLLDLQARTAPRRVDEINSERADSYHSWSSNSRWIVFSSKREDGVFTRLYLAHVDETGRFGKPFVLPQRDPRFYERCAMVFNRPELIVEPVQVTQAELARAIGSGAGGSGESKSSEEPYRPAK
jgi:dipeptidyl aminopeptidase/acylaminoacyl peptidase